MAKTRVLLAVKSLALQHLIEHLLKSRPDLEVFTGKAERDTLTQALRRSLPHLIVVSSRVWGAATRQNAAVVKRRRPGAKLIVICSVDGFGRDIRKFGADVCLAEEAIVRRLMPTVSSLSGSRNWST